MKSYDQEFVDSIKRNDHGIIMFPSGKYCYNLCFGERASFGEWASFGEGASFGEKTKFYKFPVSILRARLKDLPDDLTLERMRRDAWSHPHPEFFDCWVNDGECPYKNGESRMHFFNEKKELWKPGPPQMRDWDLIVAIAKYKKWTQD